jgi:60 kDa SS-A/Ro ribonucleoprotein
MANKSLFQTIAGKLLPRTNATNDEGAPAYRFTPKHELAQYTATGCLNSTFYASAEAQLERILELCGQVEPEFLAKTAVHCRRHGLMKDTPALLCAALSVVGPELLERVFFQVIDNGKMLRNFVQILRSGAVARKSLGSLPKRLVRQWLERQDEAALFHASVGQSPSMADVVKMVHPKPKTPQREALYGYLLGKPHDAALLPELVRELEAFKAAMQIAEPFRTGEQPEVPDVPFQMLTALDLGPREWAAIAKNAPWQMTRMNLNTFARHGVFEHPGMTRKIAQRLRDPELVRKARVFPYQLMAAHAMAGAEVPAEVREALQDAMEVAISNVPALEGKVYVCADVSGSMQSPVTGHRRGSTTAVRCVDVAALVAAAVLRKNHSAEVLPFEHDVLSLSLNARDSVMTNAAKLAAVGGGGTNCSAPLARLNAKKAKGDLVIFVSDNESWVDARGGRGTATMREWSLFRARNPEARLVCIDIQPYGTTQAAEREDILNVGGFSDQVFEVVSAFAAGELAAEHWVGLIEKVEI